MASDLAALRFRARDPQGMARFWTGLLEWELATYADGSAVALPGDDRGWVLRFVPAERARRSARTGSTST